MKTELNFFKITKEQSNELTTIVQETATDDIISAKSFSIVDLWNITRQRKTIWTTKRPAPLS